MISFFLPCDPPRTTTQEKGVRIVYGRPHFYEKKSVAEAKKLFRSLLAPHAPEQPLNGAVKLETLWVYATDKKKLDYEYKITKPDTDNMIKLLKDVMTDLGFWVDDAQVAHECTIKRWAYRRGEFKPGIMVTIELLPEVVSR